MKKALLLSFLLFTHVVYSNSLCSQFFKRTKQEYTYFHLNNTHIRATFEQIETIETQSDQIAMDLVNWSKNPERMQTQILNSILSSLISSSDHLYRYLKTSNKTVPQNEIPASLSDIPYSNAARKEQALEDKNPTSALSQLTNDIAELESAQKRTGVLASISRIFKPVKNIEHERNRIHQKIEEIDNEIQDIISQRAQEIEDYTELLSNINMDSHKLGLELIGIHIVLEKLQAQLSELEIKDIIAANNLRVQILPRVKREFTNKLGLYKSLEASVAAIEKVITLNYATIEEISSTRAVTIPILSLTLRTIQTTLDAKLAAQRSIELKQINAAALSRLGSELKIADELIHRAATTPAITADSLKELSETLRLIDENSAQRNLEIAATHEQVQAHLLELVSPESVQRKDLETATQAKLLELGSNP